MTPKSNTDIVLAFCAAWATRDADKVVAFMTEDCFYHNIPMEPLVGIPAIRALVEPFFAQTEAVDFVTTHIAEAAGGAVLNERSDRYRINGKWVALPVMGIFELRDGKIAQWRDYFDLAQFNAAMASAAT